MLLLEVEYLAVSQNWGIGKLILIVLFGEEIQRRQLLGNCETLKPCFLADDACISVELSWSWNLLFSLHSNFKWIVSNLGSLVCVLVDVKMLSALETRTNLENQYVIWEQERCSIKGFIVSPMHAAVVSEQLRAVDFLDICVVYHWVILISLS